MSALFNLPPAERARRYREFAADAARSAAGASKERGARQSYTLIAEQWRKRADAIEQNMLRYGMPYMVSGIGFALKPSAAMALT